MKRMCNFPAQFLFTIMLRYKLFVGATLLFGASVTAFYPSTVKEHALVLHNYFTLHAKDWLNCIMACNEDQRCVSYNYEYSATSNGICELNECGVDPNKPVEEVLIYRRRFVFQQLRSTEDREQCKPKICLVGYHGDGITCKDIDECTNRTHNCSQNANCTNTKGSFNCTCVKGYHGDGVMCKDIDECTNGTHNCSQNANCTNTNGSFNCTCLNGYHGDGIPCKDIDECTNGTHNCSLNANCTNTKGSFNCTCAKCYHGDGVTCKDIDECTNGTHNCSQNANCINTDGSFNCTCLEGYIGDKVTCKDIDECTNGTHNCSQNANCINTKGSFNCTCWKGYHGDGVTCKHIDECTNGTHNCSQNANCTNTKGSFNCTCVKGYHGDGVTCKACKSGWQHFKGFCYKSMDKQKPWNEAKTQCESNGASLASIHSTKENTFIVSIIPSRNRFFAWIGLNNKAVQETFTWVDNTPLDYTNWLSIKLINKREDCVVLTVTSEWTDNICTESFFYVCKSSL